MEVDTQTKKVNFYTYDGEKPLGYAAGIAIIDTEASDIGNIFMMLEANSGCDIANITVTADANKSVNEEYSLNTVEDNTSAPTALIYSDNFSKYSNNATTDWSSSGSANGSMTKKTDGEISYANVQFGTSGNSKAYWKTLGISSTAIAEFKVKNSGGGLVFFSSDTGNLHNKGNKIASVALNDGGISVETSNGSESAVSGTDNAWYTVKCTMDNVSKLYNISILDDNGTEIKALTSQPFISDTATAINVIAIALDKSANIDITDIKITENSGLRILPRFFSDVTDETTAYRNDIEYLFENGYLTESTGTEFNPTAQMPVSEAAATGYLSRARARLLYI